MAANKDWRDHWGDHSHLTDLTATAKTWEDSGRPHSADKVFTAKASEGSANRRPHSAALAVLTPDLVVAFTDSNRHSVVSMAVANRHSHLRLDLTDRPPLARDSTALVASLVVPASTEHLPWAVLVTRHLAVNSVDSTVVVSKDWAHLVLTDTVVKVTASVPIVHQEKPQVPIKSKLNITSSMSLD